MSLVTPEPCQSQGRGVARCNREGTWSILRPPRPAHTSGLTLNPRGRGLTQEQVDYATNHGNGFDTLREHVRHAAAIPGAFHLGDEWQYGDSTNYVAAVVEQISGMSINDFLQSRIFEPLGMVDTHY